jgi:hypothetical protein
VELIGALTVARRAGAVAILATGAIHLQQLIVQDFQGIPTIRVLFLLNVIGSGVVGACLLAPLRRVLARRWADRAEAAFTAVALMIAIGSLVGLFIAENGSLFGLSTHRYSTVAVLAIVVEGIAVVLLTPVLARSLSRIAARDAPISIGTAGDRPASLVTQDGTNEGEV